MTVKDLSSVAKLLDATLKKKTLSRDSILLLAEHMKIKERFLQLEEALQPGQFEKKALDHNKILRQAIFIEQSIPAVDTVAQKIITSTKAPRAIHIDTEKRLIAILPKKHPAIQAAGTSKKVVSAAAIAFETIKRLPPAVQMTPLKDSKKIAMGIEKELKVYEDLQGIEGIMEVLSVVNVSEKVRKGEVPKRSIVAMRAAGGDIQSVITKKEGIRLQQQIQWGYRLFSAFSAIHKKGYTHGDVKGDNILFGPDGMPLISDFGMAFTDKPHDMFKENLYGTMEYSAPELFCRPDSDKFTNGAVSSDYQKTEVFALGTVLYAIYKKEPLPWMEPIVTVRDSKNPDWDEETPRLQKMMREGIQTCIEAPLQTLKPTKPEEHYQWVLYNVLREDPAKRWTMDQATSYMETHLGCKRK
jgi:serine/threonine protein kinase